MVEIGYALSSEEQTPLELVRLAQRAEEVGFSFALISDHYHPWTDRQGQSPFVWAVIGGIACQTERLTLGTGVTCPTFRIHPAIIAQAAATAAAMMPGRFFLGVGSGENLNEHILGDHWPPADVRLAMLEEAIEVIRLLWQGGYVSYYGQFFTVEKARLYTRPDAPPPVVMAASGPRSLSLAGRLADGLIALAPDRRLVERFRAAGGTGKPCYAQVTVCWAETEEEAQRIAHRWWPVAVLKGQLQQELRLPVHFEQAVADVTEEEVARQIVCGPSAEKHLAALQQYIEAGYDYIYVHQVGPDQEGFFRFYAREVLPALKSMAA
ncbi:F420-dependent glucose-6-phosphate dehydrogenase [bacterium HR25]|nr:F420-dependent glucose-6-phosphate dehydrogenase [bacterium HR25]